MPQSANRPNVRLEAPHRGDRHIVEIDIDAFRSGAGWRLSQAWDSFVIDRFVDSELVFNEAILSAPPAVDRRRNSTPVQLLVYRQLKFGRGLNRQFGRSGTAQNSINIGLRMR